MKEQKEIKTSNAENQPTGACRVEGNVRRDGWVNIDNELPEYSGHYLIATEEIGFSGERHQSTAWYLADRYGQKHFYIDNREMSKMTIAYWRKLPEAPSVKLSA